MVLRVQFQCTHGFVPGYLLGQTMRRILKRMEVTRTTMRLRTFPRSAACRVWGNDLGPICWFVSAASVFWIQPEVAIYVRLGLVTVCKTIYYSVLCNGWCNSVYQFGYVLMLHWSWDHEWMHNGYFGFLIRGATVPPEGWYTWTHAMGKTLIFSLNLSILNPSRPSTLYEEWGDRPAPSGPLYLGLDRPKPNWLNLLKTLIGPHMTIT